MTGKIRIIGGLWRGRKLDVIDLPGLRPSGDRSRETMFNWLGPSIQGKHCLDLFAGTGALGLEAVSRGAASACLVEKSRLAASQIDQQIASWHNRERVEIISASARDFLKRDSRQFDLVFIDPPHGQGLQMDSLRQLKELDRLSEGARVCVEHGVKEDWVGEHRIFLNSSYSQEKTGRFGQIAISLYRASAL